MKAALKKVKSDLDATYEKGKEKVVEKTDETKEKIQEKAAKELDDFMGQMKILGPVMKESGFKLIDISVMIQLTPAISCEIENIDDNASWNDDSIDQDTLNKTGKFICWTLKQADKARKKFKSDAVRFTSFEFECPIPSLKLSFAPKEEESKEADK